jgi:GT2 family glycosyltransferase
MHLDSLARLERVEVLLVDNGSDDEYAQRLSRNFDNVRVLRLPKNFGAVGRNYGIKEARAPYVLTLDDDVWGITQSNLEDISELFVSDESIDCICFHVVDEETGATTNWMHHCDKSVYSSQQFETYEISEGAVVFRRSCFDRVGLYPDAFFISHEGPDMAFRVMNSGKRIIYSPAIQVTHAHAIEGRPSWRRYYYDTRNLIWLAYRNYNWRMLVKRFPLQLLAMFLYSVRDGYFRYYLKALRDGAFGIAQLRGSRSPVTSDTYARILYIDINRPSLWYYITERLLKNEVKL